MLQIEIKTYPNATVLKTPERIRETELDAKLKELIAANQIHLVLNFALTPIISETTLQVMVAAFQSVRRKEGDLYLAATCPKIQEILRAARLDTVFTSFPTEEQAVAAFG